MHNGSKPDFDRNKIINVIIKQIKFYLKIIFIFKYFFYFIRQNPKTDTKNPGIKSNSLRNVKIGSFWSGNPLHLF
jgi:hypothetical protein